MLRSIFYLLVLGFVGFAVLGFVFGLLRPLIGIAFNLALVMIVGYFLLRLVSPDKAKQVREKLRRVK